MRANDVVVRSALGSSERPFKNGLLSATASWKGGPLAA